jgi:hypothetical protein
MTVAFLASRTQERVEDLIQRRLGSAGEAADCFLVRRTDIDFFSVTPDRVAIEIRVTNASEDPSPAGAVVVRAAPFGAFVPWQPLATVPLPVLRPGQVHYVRTGAVPLHPQPLGSPDRLPPRKLLTALDLGDLPPEPSRPKETAEQRPGPARLPADLMQILLQETPHWIGNINILVGKTDVERHRARALRVYPGRMNLAWFFVGSGGRDAYAFRLDGLGRQWDTRLFDMTARESLVLNVRESEEIAPNQWIPCEGSWVLLLALKVPLNCTAGTVEVEVTQQSTGRKAVVEFSLDPQAAGRGCYAV